MSLKLIANLGLICICGNGHMCPLSLEEWLHRDVNELSSRVQTLALFTLQKPRFFTHKKRDLSNFAIFRKGTAHAQQIDEYEQLARESEVCMRRYMH